MVKTLHHIFFLKKSRNYEDDQPMSIYLRITVDGQRAEMATGRQINPAHWRDGHIAQKRMSDDLRELQSYLHALEEKLSAAHQELIRENKTITAETLKNKYTGASEKARMLVPIFQKHND
ncbi:MAG TPA: Arm DNA-binding domain-containing protein, partial [Flavisolibacter sp.]